jgi:hypothetical protein
MSGLIICFFVKQLHLSGDLPACINRYRYDDNQVGI